MKKVFTLLFFSLLILLSACQTEGFIELPIQSNIPQDDDDVPINEVKPEIDVFGMDIAILNNDDTPRTEDNTLFSDAVMETESISHGFVIKNTGEGVLTFTDDKLVTLSPDENTSEDDFTISKETKKSIEKDSIFNFSVVFAPTSEGEKTAMITIASNDDDENPFSFKVKGRGKGKPAEKAPEIDIIGNDNSIVDGTETVSQANHTNFGQLDLGTEPVKRIYTVNNTGDESLSLTDSENPVSIIAGENTDANDFIVVKKPATTIASGASTTFEIIFDPSTIGVKKATISIANNDSNENPYNFAIQGEGMPVASEIDVLGLDNSIINGDITPSTTDDTDFGVYEIASGGLQHTFTIENSGNGNLDLTDNEVIVNVIPGENTVVEDFVVTKLPSLVINPSSSDTFIVTFDPSSEGIKLATISIPNNDADENPYEFVIMGEAMLEVLSPEIDITGRSNSITSGDDTPAVSDNTDFSTLFLGDASIAHEFTITNSGDGDLTLTGQSPYVQITPGSDTTADDFTVTSNPSNTIAPSASTNFEITFNPSTIGTKTATVSIANNDVDEHPYTFIIQGVAEPQQIPEIDIQGAGNTIANGDTSPSYSDNTKYGEVNFEDGDITHEFTISNTGVLDLTLTGADPYVEITPGPNTNTNEFSVVIKPLGTITPGANTTFSIVFNPESEGVKSATISIANNDANENPYTFVIEGEGVVIDSSGLPCDFNLSTVTANSTVTIDCILDLGGQTVNLPSNVNFDYAGGQIINGTLNFNNGYIDGNLLNYTLDIGGNGAVLKSPIFDFVTERWDVLQGDISKSEAVANIQKLEDIFDLIKRLEGHTFRMDEFDAYFDPSTVTSTTTNQNFYPSLEAINIPSDFNLFMTDNTIFRVYPVSHQTAAVLMAVNDDSNVVVRGGVLYGDRDLRSYSKPFAEHGAHLFTIRSGINVTLDGIKFINGSVGGLNINSLGHSFEPHYNPSRNLRIANCTFEKIRRISLVLTDGNNIVIENNTFIDSGQPTAYSDGGVVGWAMNMEPVRKRDRVTGELVYYQKVHDVVVRNNTERNSRAGGFLVYSGQNVTFEGNLMETAISYSLASGTRIKNNRFVAPAIPRNGAAIMAEGVGETVFDNEIFGNEIIGYNAGINADHRDVKIYDNTITNCGIGINFKRAADMQVHNNTITSTRSGSRGFMGHIANVNNINLYNNTIDVKGNSFYFVQLNKKAGEEDYMINVYDNNIISTGSAIFSNTNGVNFHHNFSKGGIQLVRASNVTVDANNIDTSTSDGVALFNANYNIKIINNMISHPSNFQCIDNDNTSSPTEITISNNTCN